MCRENKSDINVRVMEVKSSSKVEEVSSKSGNVI